MHHVYLSPRVPYQTSRPSIWEGLRNSRSHSYERDWDLVWWNLWVYPQELPPTSCIRPPNNMLPSHSILTLLTLTPKIQKQHLFQCQKGLSTEKTCGLNRRFCPISGFLLLDSGSIVEHILNSSWSPKPCVPKRSLIGKFSLKKYSTKSKPWKT